CARYAAHRALHSFPTRRSSDLNDNAHDGRYACGASLTHCARITAANPARHFLRATPRSIRLRLSVRPFQSVEPLPDPARVSLLLDRKSTRLNSSHVKISYAVFC